MPREQKMLKGHLPRVICHPRILAYAEKTVHIAHQLLPAPDVAAGCRVQGLRYRANIGIKEGGGIVGIS